MTTQRKAPDKQAMLREREDTRWLMSTPAGRRLAWLLLAEAGVYRGSFQGDPNHTIFLEGQRAIGLSFLDRIMRHAPDAFIEMLKEHREPVDDG